MSIVQLAMFASTSRGKADRLIETIGILRAELKFLAPRPQYHSGCLYFGRATQRTLRVFWSRRLVLREAELCAEEESSLCRSDDTLPPNDIDKVQMVANSWVHPSSVARLDEEIRRNDERLRVAVAQSGNGYRCAHLNNLLLYLARYARGDSQAEIEEVIKR